MDLAVRYARVALSHGEVPIGAIVVKAGRVIGSGYNLKETRKDATAHAEILAIQSAQQHIGDWRLNGCMMYVTLEPCPMCMGAILHSRIEHVFYGATDSKWGGVWFRDYIGRYASV
jgi:tRNA(adenine34) deaminase